MKLSKAFNVLGIGDPMDYVSGLVLLLLGLIILGDGRVGIQATPSGEVRWIAAFATLPNWLGWLFIWFGFDSFFGGKLTKLLVNKVIAPILNPVAKSIVGEERLKKLQAKLQGKSKSREWIERTYGNVLDEEVLTVLELMAELKVESPMLFDYFCQSSADRIRYKGITEEMIEKTVKYLETK